MSENVTGDHINPNLLQPCRKSTGDVNSQPVVVGLLMLAIAAFIAVSAQTDPPSQTRKIPGQRPEVASPSRPDETSSDKIVRAQTALSDRSSDENDAPPGPNPPQPPKHDLTPPKAPTAFQTTLSYFMSLYFVGLFAILSLFTSITILRLKFPFYYRALSIFCVRWSGIAIVALGLLVLIFGSYGFWEKNSGPKTQNNSAGQDQNKSAAEDPNNNTSTIVGFYKIFQLFLFNVGPEQLDSFSLKCAAALAMLLWMSIASRGILILFHGSWEKLQLLKVSEHIIICGLGRIGYELLRDLIKNSNKRLIVIIEPDENNVNVKWAREHGILCIVGDATKRDILVEAVVACAHEVFLVTGRDECNIESTVQIRNILKKKGRATWLGSRLPPLRCFVHINDRDLAISLRDRADAIERDADLPKEGKFKDVAERLIDIEVFNALERTSHRLLSDIAKLTFGENKMRPVAADEVAHYVMMGFGEFGQTLALLLGELAHFENGRRLRLTVIDHDIEKTARQFISKYPRFGPEFGQISNWQFKPDADDWSSRIYSPPQRARLTVDPLGVEYACNTQFIEFTEATDEDFLRAMNAAFERPGVKPVILVCFDDDRRNFAIAERLSEKLKTMEKRWPIFVWVPRQRELSQLLTKQYASVGISPAPAGNGSELFPFGQCHESVSYSAVTQGWTDWLAKIIHLVWIPLEPEPLPAIKSLQGACMSPNLVQQFCNLDWKSIDEAAHSTWNRMEEKFRASNRSAAIHAAIKAAAMGYQIEGVSDTVTMLVPNKPLIDEHLSQRIRIMEHNRWTAERLIKGWRYASTNSPVMKTRWQITPWKHLDPREHGVAPAIDPITGGIIDERIKDQKIVALLEGLIGSGKLRTKPVGS